MRKLLILCVLLLPLQLRAQEADTLNVQVDTLNVQADSLNAMTDSLLFASDTVLTHRDSVKLIVEERVHEIVNKENFKPRVLVATGAVLTLGAIGVDNKWYHENLNSPMKRAADYLRDKYGRTHIDDVAQYVPMAAYLGLGYIPSVPNKHSGTERFMAAATSAAIMAALVNGLKYSVGKLRPDESTSNSFPSGHTATAFTGAELIMMEYGGWYGVGAYVVAGGVGLCRIYNNRHWFSDVLGGAAIGVLSAHAAYWLLPAERRLFKMEDKQSQLVVVPTGTGLSLAYAF